jgi:hypothetical protein
MRQLFSSNRQAVAQDYNEKAENQDETQEVILIERICY